MLIEVRSTVGPISFGTIDISGTIQAVVDEVLRTDISPTGQLTIDMRG